MISDETKLKIKSHLISAGITIGTAFMGTVGIVFAAIPDEKWTSPEVYTTAFWVSIGYAVIRGVGREIVGSFVKNYFK